MKGEAEGANRWGGLLGLVEQRMTPAALDKAKLSVSRSKLNLGVKLIDISVKRGQCD
jgi:hypothetical protein